MAVHDVAHLHVMSHVGHAGIRGRPEQCSRLTQAHHRETQAHDRETQAHTPQHVDSVGHNTQAIRDIRIRLLVFIDGINLT